MSDHTVRYEINHNGYGIDTIVECHVEPNAGPCRVGDCGHGCEQWVDLQRQPDGWWTHCAYDEAANADVMHALGPYSGGGCNYLNWMDGTPEEYFRGDTRSATPGPITFVWDGDNWQWEYADEPTASAVLADLVDATPLDVVNDHIAYCLLPDPSAVYKCTRQAPHPGPHVAIAQAPNGAVRICSAWNEPTGAGL